jgi:molybdopterin-guanine dinucleotide biosynthesis protein A
MLFENVIIVANQPEPFKQIGIRTIPDIMPGCGPLGGIYTGLVNSTDDYNFMVACDMPFVNQNLVNYMLNCKEGSDCIIPSWNGKLEPLCAVYSRRCIEPVSLQLKIGDLKAANICSTVKTRIIHEKEIEGFDPSGLSFTNINTKEDYERISNVKDHGKLSRQV